jgi:hypothetical protein
VERRRRLLPAVDPLEPWVSPQSVVERIRVHVVSHRAPTMPLTRDPARRPGSGPAKRGSSDYIHASHTGRSAARLARLLREQEVPGSNPGAPILQRETPSFLRGWRGFLRRQLSSRWSQEWSQIGPFSTPLAPPARRCRPGECPNRNRGIGARHDRPAPLGAVPRLRWDVREVLQHRRVMHLEAGHGPLVDLQHTAPAPKSVCS